MAKHRRPTFLARLLAHRPPMLIGEPARLLISLARRHWLSYAVVLALTAISVTLSFRVPFLLPEAVDRAYPSNDLARVRELMSITLALIGCHCLLAYSARRLATTAGGEIADHMRVRVHDLLLRLPPSWHIARPPETARTLLFRDAEVVGPLFILQLATVLESLCLGAAFAFASTRLDRSGLILCGLVGAALVLTGLLGGLAFTRRMEVRRRMLEALSTVGEVLSVAGLRFVAAGGFGDGLRRSFARRGSALRDTDVAAWQASHRIDTIQQAITMAILPLALLLGSGTSATLGATLASAAMATLLVAPLTGITNLLLRLGEHAPALRALTALLADAPLGGRRGCLVPASAPVRVIGLTVEIGGRTVLSDISFSLPAGVWACVEGPSGAGKSTLAAALAGIQERRAGSITIGGHRLDALAPGRAVGYLPQVPFLFALSVREMLTLRGDRSDAELEELLWIVGLDRAVSLDLRLAPEASNLSGGERHRLALATILALESRVLILDEAFSQLDTPTASKVRDRVREWAQARAITVVEIVHGDHHHADVVLRLEQGRLVKAARRPAWAPHPRDGSRARVPLGGSSGDG